MNENDKYRHELKYMCSEEQIANLTVRLNALLTLDKHVENGSYNIRSLYFDNFENRCYFENEDGTNPREKYRIRIYNHSNERITLECKQKKNGMTHKTACLLSMKDYDDILNRRALEDIEFKPALLRKFHLLLHTQLFKPSIIVDYDRIPYVFKEGNVRITIDKNISSSTDFSGFFKSDIHRRPIQPTGQHLIEIKYDEFLPEFIKTSLQTGELQQVTFSKYYLCKKFSIGGLL